MPKIRLIDLDPKFVGAGGTGITKDGKPVEKREGVGLSCECPCGCDSRVFVYFKNPMDGKPYPTKAPQWERFGDEFKELTLRPSIRRVGGCNWHGYLTGGVFKAC